MTLVTTGPGGLSRHKQKRLIGTPTDSKRIPGASEPAMFKELSYDALDYRLMATFPASDATAKY